MPSFTSLGLPEVLVRALAERGVTEPFPIQSATLPDTLAGRDVLGRGRTGSGKTLAFALPMVARLSAGQGSRAQARRVARRPRGLVLAPTRELATQIAATLEPLAQAAGLRVTTIFGGVSQHRQEVALAAGVDVVVACPGRLEDLLGQRVLTLDDVEITVLDEADHMADLGFLPGVRRILAATPSDGQRLLFSATLDNGVDQLVSRFLSNPLRHSVDPASSPVVAMTHHVFTVDSPATKKAVVHELAAGSGRRLLFTRTKHQARTLARRLTADGIPAVDLHGNLSQNARERNLEAFASGAVRVMVATDIAARGIHVDEIALVVHVDPPAEHKAYLHRSGRTARAGSGGDVVTLVLPEQNADMRTLARQARIDARPVAVVAGDARVTGLIGERAAHVVPAAPVAASPQRPAGRGAGGSGQGGRGRGRGGRGRSEAAGRGQAAPAQGGRSQGGRSQAGRAQGANGQGGRTTASSSSATTTDRPARRHSAVELSMRGSSRRGR